MTLKPASIGILLISTLLALVLAFGSVLPFLAERAYRDGYNASQNQQYADAIAKFNTAVRLAPLEAFYRVEYGRAYEDSAKTLPPDQAKPMILKAKKIYEKLLSLDDLNPWYQNRMAAIHIELARLEPNQQSHHLKKAEDYTRNAAKLDPNNPLFQLNLAYFLQNSGRISEAKTYYLRTISIDGTLNEARYNLAALYLNEDKIEDALNQYLEIYATNPQMPGLLAAIGRVYLAIKQPETALKYLQESAEVFPFDRVGLVLLAETYHRLGNTEATIATLESVVKRFPDDIGTRSNLIRLYQADGQVVKAAEQENIMRALSRPPQ